MKVLFVTFLLLCLVNPVEGQVALKSTSPIALDIQLDFESSKAIIKLFEKTKVSDSDLLQVSKLFGSQQLIKKVGSYNGAANEAVFIKTLREAIETGTVKSDDPFDWKSVRNKQLEIKKLIDQLETQKAFTDDVKALLLPYTPGNITATVRACFLVGGGALGFVLNDSNTFNVALQKVGDDYEGLVYLVAHELYHSVQGIGRSNRIKEKPLNAPPKSIIYAEALLRNLWTEGSANLVGDFTKIKSPGAFAKTQQDEYETNSKRSVQNFALFESLLFTAYADTTANIEELYNIGFSVAYDETSYYTGYEMAKAIEKYKGHQALADCINKVPLEFCRLYITLYKGNPKSKLVKFNTSTEAILSKLELWKKSF